MRCFRPSPRRMPRPWRPATMLGDTGDFTNTIYTGFPVARRRQDSVTPFLESDPVLGDVDEHFAGDYLDEATILKAGPRPGLQHRRHRQGRPDLDLRSHRPHRHADHHRRRRDRQPEGHSAVGRDDRAPQGGKPAARAAAARRKRGNYARHHRRQRRAAGLFRRRRHAQRCCRMFKERDRPFVLVFWSRDPDGTQHNQGDSLNSSCPASTARPRSPRSATPTTIWRASAPRSASSGSLETTDIIVSRRPRLLHDLARRARPARGADASSPTCRPASLPPGFVALDLAGALELPLFDPDDKNAADRARASAANSATA